MYERTSNCLFSYTHMLLICPHALLLCFRYLMDVFLFLLCARLQRRVLEPKQPNCAFGLIIREPMLWNNELNSNQSWSCCWFCVHHFWSSLDCIAMCCNCSFTADLFVICSYVCLIDDDCSAVGVLGKFPVYSALSPQQAPIRRQLDLYWHPRWFTPLRSNWECVGLSY